MVSEKMDIKWHYTNKLVNDLIKINNVKEITKLLKLPLSIEEEIKKETIVKRVHYSTKIEGNRLNLNEVKEVIENNIKSHERNVLEVRNYYNALMYLNDLSDKKEPITEDLILKLHNLVIGKKITYKNNFRDGQNVVEDSLTKKIVYLPPEASDVSSLIKDMIIELNESNDIPVPIKAGIFAYKFLTIHPFWDGNGRCARLLANYILKLYDYDLRGFYVLEEYYDKNIEEYYNSLQMGLHHNYYFGRNKADITAWLEYFVSVMSKTFDIVEKRIKNIYEKSQNEVNLFNTLDKRERWVANFIINHGKIKAKDIASHFKISLDTANNWLKKWMQKEFLTRYDMNQKRNVDYILTEKYIKYLLEHT